ncbi:MULTISPECIES: GNAT family N-acetyltransferase [Algoriphagus]|jgi:ribosomal protein S18 acetylase RimI-like enzyme|uniref:GNAT family N-acetyltransferase n=5 Tax=Algoriphagus TaxID=246875 RepID=A0A5C7AZ78_9BACT|nr:MULTISPECIES: GNAT family N-acetyltransferase [Algoriphagus]MAL13722.1 GNAT family N-acetyltransferase [Algoriphagus sp.]MAN86008.1 GNAT family N-acetyltransferase [Algoriphagus sp.]MBB6327624.1 ribosomal protein S18 acetylase RimI-like enzyme [Algoriphagus iocasae]MBS4070469.1 GNAT family N-acetyltransferase [Algoriphagus sp.]MDI1324467.1 GNAT family N-acetyltransferase [Algoriphagus sp.]|tara:strand:+ start:532 stop:1101 length:570 start_codon:yes stop_codon:yes gene_type:complete
MRKFIEQDREKVITILVNSFEGNKSVDFVVGNSATSRRILMEYSLANCLENGEVYISESGKSCVLIKYSNRKRKSFNLWIWDLKLALQGIGISKISKVLKRESSIERVQPNEPFLYVWFIGVEPENQGKGEGSMLLKSVLELAKKKNLPVCLETSTERNFRWYENFGFSVYASSDEFGFPFYFYKKDLL